MSFVYDLLTEIKWNETDENHEGLDLYHRFYNEQGEPKCNWTDEYRAWLVEICDAWEIPEGQFRKAWIVDALHEAHETDLELIKQWFEPEEDEEDEPEDEVLEFKGGDDFKISMTKKEWYDFEDYTGDDALKAVAIGSKESQFEITYKPKPASYSFNNATELNKFFFDKLTDTFYYLENNNVVAIGRYYEPNDTTIEARVYPTGNQFIHKYHEHELDETTSHYRSNARSQSLIPLMPWSEISRRTQLYNAMNSSLIQDRQVWIERIQKAKQRVVKVAQ